MISGVHWNVDMVATLYYKSVPNNIIVRANNTLYNDINDEEIREYIRVFKESGANDNIYLQYLHFGNVKAFLDNDNGEYVYTIMYNSKIGSGLINALKTEVMITKLIGKMSESTLRKLIIAPLKPICNRNVPHIANFTINIGKAIYTKDHPFSRDITLISNDNIQRPAHSFVIAGVSPMVCSAITNFASSDNKTFKLDCSVGLVDWFIEGAYKSSFVFDEKIDHEDGLNLLNYLLVINKVVVISELRSKLNIELSVN